MSVLALASCSILVAQRFIVPSTLKRVKFT